GRPGRRERDPRPGGPRAAGADPSGVPRRHRPEHTEAVRAVSRRRTSTVDLATRVGSVVLPNPVMTASGTAGHGAELSDFFDLSELGAVVVKSVSAQA